MPEWQTAIGALVLVARSGPTMMARIGGHESAELSCRAGVQSRSQRYPLGQAEAQEGPMKTYFLMALAGLLACAIAGMIFMEMTQQVSPD